MDPGTVLQALNVLDDEAAIDVIGQALTARPHIAPRVVAASCPDLTYAPARALTERRSTGVVKMVSRDGNYGFISCPELQVVFGCDVFVSHKQLNWFAKGQTVSFAVLLNREQKPQAFDLAEASTSTDGKGNVTVTDGLPKAGGVGTNAAAAAAWGAVVNAAVAAATGGGGGVKGRPSLPIADTGKGPSAGAAAGGKAPQVPMGEHLGVLRSVNPEKGYGFIVCETLKGQVDGDVYVHGSQTAGFKAGSEVRFEAYLHNARPQGRNLKDATGMLSREAVQAAMLPPTNEISTNSLPLGGGSGPPGGAGGNQEIGQFVGKVKMYNQEKRFGFVACDDLVRQGYPGDVFVSMKNTPGSLNVGDDLSITVALVNGRLQGKDAQVVGSSGQQHHSSDWGNDYGGGAGAAGLSGAPGGGLGGGSLAADWHSTGPAGSLSMQMGCGGAGTMGGAQAGGDYAPPPVAQGLDGFGGNGAQGYATEDDVKRQRTM
eukprot:TRINITY_DN75791_c0_g1_i1.p1 TRINITY_DN75791_c0_g1~~TRINITY_DN75791_c0_g1_i1.p1  ORF type:complete len:504 (+),score=95.53 TRINITY_DN75791_c0_g1_i1:56-1513(+)